MTPKIADIAIDILTRDIALRMSRLTHIVRESSTRDIAKVLKIESTIRLTDIARVMTGNPMTVTMDAGNSMTARMGATQIKPEAIAKMMGDSIISRMIATFRMGEGIGMGERIKKTFEMGESIRKTFRMRISSRHTAIGNLVSCALIIFLLRVRWASIPQGLMGRP